MKNWWFIGSQNMLQGIEGDDSNPPKLPSNYIASFFYSIPAAVSGYYEIRSTLTEEEQNRCDGLLRTAQNLGVDPKKELDEMQHLFNTQGIRTAGKYAGTRRGGNC
jgi:hypothetical protein